MKVTIELPETVSVSKGTRGGDWQATLAIPVAKLSPAMIAQATLYGLTQKFADSASQAKTKDEADAAMAKALDNIMAGDWTRRGTGGVDPFTRHARVIMRQSYKVKANEKQWAAFTGLSDADQVAKLDALVEKNRDAIADAVAARIEEERVRNAARKELANAVTLDF